MTWISTIQLTFDEPQSSINLQILCIRLTLMKWYKIMDSFSMGLTCWRHVGICCWMMHHFFQMYARN